MELREQTTGRWPIILASASLGVAPESLRNRTCLVRVAAVPTDSASTKKATTTHSDVVGVACG